MKTFLKIVIWTIVIFVVLTLITMKQEAAHDGIDAYGFPFTFYDEFGGKPDVSYDQYGFKPLFLLVDIGIIMALLYPILKVKADKK